MSFPMPGQAQPYAAFVKKTDRQSGLIDILRRDDEVYFDLTKAQFDQPFIVAPVLASGVDFPAFGGRVYDPFVLEFKRVGKRVLWISKNTFFSADNAAAQNALDNSVADSVVNVTPVLAEDEAGGRVVISASFFLSDFENVGHDLGGGESPILLLGGASRPTYSVDAARSYIETTKALPKNDEILASLAFIGPPNADPGAAPDPRGVILRMHYSIVAPLDDAAYVPRLADDRVGYFIAAQKRFGNDNLPTPFVRYIERWNFARGPIVYYLTNEIPPEYKPAIRSALLEWNAVFAKIGIPNAIEVRDQPDDPGWDPDDIRYSTVRWLTSDRPGFAGYGPIIADPRTGEILRSEIVIEGETLRTVKRGYANQVLPTRAVPVTAAPSCPDPSQCDDFLDASAELAAAGTLQLRASGASSEQVQHYADEWLTAAVLHEAGHTFGLRHNFAAAIYPLAKLHDRSFTQTHGLVSSVMNYTPVNLSPPGEPQGDYFQLRPGPYDYWAIRYGYEKLPNVSKPGDEVLALRHIAEESTRPDYAYASDEDVIGARAIDPHVARFLLSSDTFDFYANQFSVSADLVAKLDRVFPSDDRPYVEERQAFLSTMTMYRRAALLAAQYVGGIYTSRDHRGQPGGEPPFRPISREDERRAFAVVSERIFSSKAFRFSPQLLADLGPGNYLHRGSDDVLSRPDFPIEEYVAEVQDSVMFQIFSPDVMSRLADQQLKVEKPGDTMSLEDLFGWTSAAVWDDVRAGMGPIDPLHRALQRRYTNLLVAFTLAPTFLVDALGYPSDSTALARFELERLAGRLDVAARSPHLDVATRAHLDDERSRVRHALDAASTRG